MTDLAESLEEGLILIGPDGGLEFWSDRGCELLGYPDGPSLVADWGRVRERLAEALGDLSSVRRGGLKRRVWFRSEGRERHLEARIFTIDEEDCTSHLLLLRDYGRVREIESRLLLGSQMRHVAEQYSALAHDMKTPLNAMVVTLDVIETSLVEDRGKGSLDLPFLVRQISTLKEEAARLSGQLRFVQKLLSVPQDPWSEFDLRSVLEEIVEQVRLQVGTRSIELRLGVPDEALPVAGHVDQIRRIFQNLLVNALEALEEKGGKVSVRASREGPMVRVDVEDDGPGIAADARQKIFDASFTTKEWGSGIGLFVVKSTVEMYGGSAELGEGVDGGALFTVRIPLDTEE